MFWIHLQTQPHEHSVNTAFPKAFNVAIQSENDNSREQAVHFYWYLCISQFISKDIARSTEENQPCVKLPS